MAEEEAMGMRAALRKVHGAAKDVQPADGTRVAAGKDHGAAKDVGAARAASGKGHGAATAEGKVQGAATAEGKVQGAAKDVGASHAASGKGQGAATAVDAVRPQTIRGPGISGSRRIVDAESSDAWSDEDESQLESNAPHGHGGGEEVAVPVEPPAVWHTSWEAWNSYLATYSERTRQVLPVRETMSRAERNKRLSKTKRGVEESQLVPEGFDPYNRVYICTHGWKKRKSRGKRPRQHIRLTGCRVRFVVQWNLDKHQLQVKNGYYVHNHDISGSSFATYPSSRGVVDPLVGARVEGMLAVGAKRSKIYDYLLEHDQNVIQVDVDNMVRDHASSVSTMDDNDATARELAAFASLDPENVSAVAETAGGETGVISLASAHMRRIYGRFSELLLVDCSHKTNRYNYQLLTFMTMNEFGEGAVVQQSLLEANGDWHMERAIAHFKRLHPTRIERLRVIVVDKDLNEIKVLESNFPKVRVLICHFHVIKYLKEKRSKPEYCKISADDASQVDAAIHAMVYADSEDNYTSSHDSLRGICDRVGMQDFFGYFEKNWHASQDRWVLYLRAKLPHFKNHTNNRLENFFGKLKDAVDGSMSMAGCVKALVQYDRRKENEYKYRLARVRQFVNSNYDEEMTNVLRFTSHFVAEQIAGQYARALASSGRYQYALSEEDTRVVDVCGPRKTHRLRVDTWECDYEFGMTMMLPCRHAMTYRREEKSPGPVIPWVRIDPRWTNTARDLKRIKQFTYETFRTDSNQLRKVEKRTHAQRYREAVRATHLICSELADIDDEEEFDDMMEFVLYQWRNVRQRKMVSVPRVATPSTTMKHAEKRNCSDKVVKAEFQISSSESDGQSNEDEYEDDTELNERQDAAPAAAKIRLNPKTKKVGAPRKHRKITAAGERADRKWYNAAERGRRAAGEVTLTDLLDSLEEDDGHTAPLVRGAR